MQQRSSKGHLRALTHRLAHMTRLSDFKAYRASDGFVHALLHMTPADRVIAFSAYFRAHYRLIGNTADLPQVPRLGNDRVKWTPERIARLKAAEAKHGNDEGIAAELGLSAKAARRARWRYVGPRAPGATRSAGVSATSNGP